MEDAPALRYPCSDKGELFFSDDHAAKALAKAICAGCIHRIQCRRWAGERKATCGIWGGLEAPDETRRWNAAQAVALVRRHPSAGGAA